MASEIQQLVERLADRLDRSVAVDDSQLRLLAHSPHRGAVDAVRAESILQRAVPAEVAAHVFACRDAATGLHLVTPRPDLGLTDARIGTPILHDGTLLGFVWFLESDGPVDAGQLAAAAETALAAATIIHRDHLRAASVSEHETALIARLLGTDAADRAAAASLLSGEALISAGPYAVIVADVSDEHADDERQLALASALAAVRLRRRHHDLLTFERRAQGIVVVTERAGDGDRAQTIATAEALRDAVATADGAVHVGVSRPFDDLRDAARAVDDAQSAVRIGRRVPTFSTVVLAEQLGVYALLDQIPEARLRESIHPGVLALLEQGERSAALVQTLDVYLDCAGDVAAASERLFAHRTSLYYRLRRIAEITGLDLSSGDDRLAAHLGLRIADLIGLRDGAH